MAKRGGHPISAADGRPRIWISQVLRDGQTYGKWATHPAGDGKIELTVPLAIQAALAAIEHQPAVIIWCGRETAL